MKFKWTSQQVKALCASIFKWEKIVDRIGSDKGPQNCPCCLEWLNESEIKKCCIGCPIMEYTGKKYCNGTPYELWCEETKDYSFRKGMEGRQVQGVKSSELAVQEVEFLKKVLKAGRK